MPATVLLNYKDGVYAIDSYSPEYDDPDKNVLTWLVSGFFFLAVTQRGLTSVKGTLLENFLTREPEDFQKFMRLESSTVESDEKIMKQAYRYAKVGVLFDSTTLIDWAK